MSASAPPPLVVAGLSRWHEPLVRAALECAGLHAAEPSALGHPGSARAEGARVLVPDSTGGRKTEALREAFEARVGGDRASCVWVVPGSAPADFASAAERLRSPAVQRGLGEAMLLGDVLRDVACRIRPYEVEAGGAERILGECVRALADALRARVPSEVRPTWTERLLAPFTRIGGSGAVAALARMTASPVLSAPLEQCATALDAEVEVDDTRPRPVVRIEGPADVAFALALAPASTPTPTPTPTPTRPHGGPPVVERPSVIERLEALGAEVRPGSTTALVIDACGPRCDWLARRLVRRGLDDFREPFRGLVPSTRDPVRGEHLVLDVALPARGDDAGRAPGAVPGPASGPGPGPASGPASGQGDSSGDRRETPRSRATGSSGGIGVAGGAGEAGVRGPEHLRIDVATWTAGSASAEALAAALRRATARAEREWDAMVAATGFTTSEIRRFVRDRRDLRRPLRPLAASRFGPSTAAAFGERVAAELAREKGMKKEIHWHP